MLDRKEIDQNYMEYKITLKNFCKYLRRTFCHKWYVFRWCCKAGMPVRGLLHDMSKFSPVEFWESVRYFSDKESPINVCKRENGYSMAWQHHKGRNPHHYEYWIDQLDFGGKPLPMPKKYAYEMICDYLGAGQAYNPKGWSFEKEWRWWQNRLSTCKMAMHPKTKQFVSTVLARLADAEVHGMNIEFSETFLDICWGIAEDWSKGVYFKKEKD